MLIVLLMVALAWHLVSLSQKSLQESVGKSSVFLADEMLKRINHSVYLKMEEMRIHSGNALLLKTISESNRKFDKMKVEDVQEYMDQKEREWVLTAKDEITPFMRELIGSELSDSIRKEIIEFYEKNYGYSVFEEIFITNKYGANVVLTGKTSDYRQNDEKWWHITKSEGFYISDVEYDMSVEGYAISIAVRIDDREGNFAGIMKAVLNIKAVVREAEIAVKEYETTRIKLMTNDGKLIYSTKTFRFLEEVSKQDFFKKIKGESGFFIAEQGGVKKLYSYTRSKAFRNFEGLPWILLMGHNINEVLKPAFVLRNNMVAASFVLIIIGTVVAFYISRSLTKPVTRLREIAEDIREDKPDVVIDTDLKESQNEIGDLAVSFDRMIKKRKQVEEALKKSEEQFRTFTQISPVGVFISDVDGHTVYWNKRLDEITGISADEGKGKGWEQGIHPEDRERVAAKWYESVKKRAAFRSEYRFLHRSGRTIWTIGQAVPMRDSGGEVVGFVGTITDITDLKEAEEKIKTSLEEKNLLLKEIHHRVKNNMQVISSILVLQSVSLDKETTDIFRECQNRIKSMALIHDKLYMTEDLTHIDFREYIETLSRSLFISYKKDTDRIGLKIDVRDVFLSIDTAVPLGLLINELVSNSLEHAFPEGREGEIEMVLQNIDDDHIELRVKDNGIGLPKDFDFRNTESLGFQLIILLAETQLHGEVRLGKDEGTEIQISLTKKARYKKI